MSECSTAKNSSGSSIQQSSKWQLVDMNLWYCTHYAAAHCPC